MILHQSQGSLRRSKGAQRKLKVSRAGLQYLVFTGRLKPIVVDGEKLYAEADLERLARERERARQAKVGGLKSRHEFAVR